jgi:hypothetical protein
MIEIGTARQSGVAQAMGSHESQGPRSSLVKFTIFIGRLTGLLVALGALVAVVPSLKEKANSAWCSVTTCSDIKPEKVPEVTPNKPSDSPPIQPPPHQPTQAEKDAEILAKINSALASKVGLNLGSKFNSGGRAWTKTHVSNSIITGNFNSLDYVARDNDDTKITVYSDSDFVVRAITLQNTSDAGQGILKAFYTDMLRAWDDNDPINLISSTVDRHSVYGPDRLLAERDRVRLRGQVKYAYYYQHQLDIAFEPEFERIFIGLAQ